MFFNLSPQGVGIIAPVLGGWKCESWLVFGRYWLPWTFFEQIIVARTPYLNKVWTTFSLYSYIKYWQPSVFMFLNSKKLPRKQGSFSCINMCISAVSCRHSPAGATIDCPPENKKERPQASLLVPLTGLDFLGFARQPDSITLWCGFRPAGNQQHATGMLHLEWFSSAHHGNKKDTPMGCLSYLA